jgi:threonine dehydrogenase-like Zn-dependent dehydrogenase
MKAIVNTEPGVLEFLDVRKPEPMDDQVRIKTAACAVCATDIHMIDGGERSKYPQILGHEWSGFVDSVGAEADRDLIGRFCVAENVMGDGGEIGFEHPGGYGEYFLTEARNLQCLPKSLSPAAACLIEPTAVCVRGLRRLRLSDSRKPILVFGDGPIGILMLMLLFDAGARDLLLVGGRTARLNLAAELTGAQTINYHSANSDLGAVIRETRPDGFKHIVEASGSAGALSVAFGSAARGAKILVLGDYGSQRADFYWNLVLLEELELIGSNASSGAWNEAANIGLRLPLASLITSRLPASEIAGELPRLLASRDEVKVVFEW